MLFGCNDVGTHQQKVGRQTGGEAAIVALACQRQPLGQAARNRPSDEDGELVAQSRQSQPLARQLLFGLGQQGFRLPIGERGGHARIQPQLRDPEPFAAAFGGRFGQRDLLFGFDDLEIGRRGVGDQRKIEGALRRHGGEIFGARGFAEAGDPAPEIEFEAADADADIEAVERHRRRRALYIAGIERGIDAQRLTRAGRPAGRDDRRQLAAVLNAIARSRLLDPRRGGEKIAIVLQRAPDQRDEARIIEPFAIGQLRRDHLAIGAIVGIEDRCGRGLRARMLWRHARATGEGRRSQREDEGGAKGTGHRAVSPSGPCSEP